MTTKRLATEQEKQFAADLAYLHLRIHGSRSEIESVDGMLFLDRLLDQVLLRIEMLKAPIEVLGAPIGFSKEA